MSGLRDSRVLAAFTAGIQRSYMISLEQRVSSALDLVSAETGGLVGRLNHTFTSSTSSFSTSSTTAVNVTGMSVTLTTTGGTLLVFAAGEMFYLNTSTGGSGEFGFSVDGGAVNWVWMHDVAGSDNDVYGLAAIRAYTVSAGSHTVQAKAKVSSGTLNISAGSDWPRFMMAIEI